MTEKQYLKCLGNRIMEARETLGLSREDLAKKVKLTRMHVYRIEEGKNPTNIIVLRRISQEFGMSVGELVDK